MKTIGIIGGIGPESTVEYYRAIIAAYAERQPDGSYPSVLIKSIDLKKLLGLVAANEPANMIKYLVDEITRLANAGAQIGLIAANTPHMVFDEIQAQSPIPLVSIVQVTCAAAKALGLTRLALFGTRATMQGSFYADVFLKKRITVVAPDEDGQAFIHQIYFEELVKGIVLPETRERLLDIADEMKKRDGVEGLILGGTELSLILREPTAHGIPVLDTTLLHARAIVEEAFS
jgi:aspartate racemase